MNTRFAGKLKSELALRIKEAMNEKGIATYKELIKKSGVSINNHFSDVLIGRQAIKESDLLKISVTLDIPMEYFRRKMKAEVRYRVEEYVPVTEEANKHHRVLLTDEERRQKIREYNTAYQRKRRARIKAQREVIK